MMTEEKNPSQKKKKGVLYILFVLLVLALLFITGVYIWLERGRSVNPTQCSEIWIDTSTLAIQFTDTIPKKKRKLIKPDTLRSTQESVDTLKKVVDPCVSDTIAPWVYPDPSGGLHYSKVMVRLISSKPCSISWKLSTESQMKLYTNNDSIPISTNATLCYQAKDQCGNIMDLRCESYEISQPLTKKYCPEDMEYVKVGSIQFCIDRYEWPNKKERKPQSHISIYHAIDSCFVRNKYLCSTEQWTLACAGPYSWQYPYAEQYESHACNTHGNSVQLSGINPECRGYFGIYDMSGNLSEWTNTKSTKENNYYNVMGGFWESGPQSDCFSQRYSYYPQNAHNPVGFRCCKDIVTK